MKWDGSSWAALGGSFLGGGPVGVQVLSLTVFDDGAGDVLQGSAGQDWYFANLVGGVVDLITGLGGSEVVEELVVLAP